MGEFGSSSSNARPSPAAPFWVGAIALIVIVAACLTLVSCGDRIGFAMMHGGGGRETRFACPRPAGVSAAQPGFNDQEREIRALRRLAFRNDFFAQLELGRRYSAVRATDKNIEDPIEAAVWYAMALTNAEGYAPINRAVRKGFGAWRPLSRYDDCREWERHTAYDALDRMLGRMSVEEQAKVRNRVIYLLSTMNAEGFRTLARLHDKLYGPFGEPADNTQAIEAQGRAHDDRRDDGRRGDGFQAAVSLFPRNDVDAYLYNYLAVQTGDVSAYVLLKDFERSAPERASYGAFVEAKAKRWVPPYEFYPPEAPDGGVPHSDESKPRGDDAYEYALSRMPELPFVHVGRALRYLGVSQNVAANPNEVPTHDVETLQAALGLPMDGRLTNQLRLRAIQYAAVNGSAQAQLVLAVMYEEGVGVPADYARSFHWFSEADRQGSPEAKFAMSAFFALGVEGVADQDKAKAVVLRIDSALEGFHPTVSRLQAVLAQVSYGPRRRID